MGRRSMSAVIMYIYLLYVTVPDMDWGWKGLMLRIGDLRWIKQNYNMRSVTA
jgi:hypothetical protein